MICVEANFPSASARACVNVEHVGLQGPLLNRDCLKQHRVTEGFYK